MSLKADENRQLRVLFVPQKNISITKHGLKISEDDMNYERFVSEMRIREQDFCHALDARH